MALALDRTRVICGGRAVIKDVSLTVEKGQATAVLGANGAGKSELVLGVAGMLKIAEGAIRVDGQDITNLPACDIRSKGVAVVPEGHRVLTKLTVDENLRAAGALHAKELELLLEEAYDRFPELAERKDQMAGTLSGGQQQMVALAHALMGKPVYILIDEMSLGLAPLIVQRLMKIVEELKQEGVGILLIEQFTSLALQHCENAVVLRNGTLTYCGDAGKLRENPEVLDKAYFG